MGCAEDDSQPIPSGTAVIINPFETRALPLIVVMALTLVSTVAAANPLSSKTMAQLTAHQPVQVIVEFDSSATDQSALAERTRRHLTHDDPSILALRAQAYAATKAAVETAVGGSDAARVRNYTHFPLAVWRLSSVSALQRLQAHPSVRAVHEDIVLHADSVSDLGFIYQPAAAAAGAVAS